MSRSGESISGNAADSNANNRRQATARSFSRWLRGVWDVEPTQDFGLREPTQDFGLREPTLRLTSQETDDQLTDKWLAAQAGVVPVLPAELPEMPAPQTLIGE